MTYGPVIRGRASICTWNLRFRFYEKNQCCRFIEKFMALDVAGADGITYECVRSDSLIPDEHWIDIEGGLWASNLTTLAKLLEEIDYQEESQQ